MDPTDPQSMGSEIAVKDGDGADGQDETDKHGERCAMTLMEALKSGDAKKVWSAFQAIDSLCDDDEDEAEGTPGEE